MKAESRTSENAPLDMRKLLERVDLADFLTLIGRNPKGMEIPLAAFAAAFPRHLSGDANEISAEFAHQVDATLERAGEAAAGIRKKVSNQADSVHEHVAKHPVAAASAALAIGYILGRAALSPQSKQPRA